jgi:FkbM family methyltransferase
VFSFEPQPETFKQLCANLFINGCQNVQPMRLALGDRRGTAFMTIMDGNNGASHLAEDGQLPVEMERLDDLTSLQGLRISLIKLDVEGHELAVLAGGEKLIMRNRPIIFFETWPQNQTKTIRWLEDRSFSVRNIDSEDYVALGANRNHFLANYSNTHHLSPRSKPLPETQTMLMTSRHRAPLPIREGMCRIREVTTERWPLFHIPPSSHTPMDTSWQSRAISETLLHNRKVER